MNLFTFYFIQIIFKGELELKKITFLLVGIFLLFLSNGEKGYANAEEKKYISEHVITSLTIEDFVKAHEIMFTYYDVENLTEEELNTQAALILNGIYYSKIDGIQLLSSPDLPIPGNLNAHEIALAVANPFDAIKVYNATNTATNTTLATFVNGGADHNNANAFKHSYWNALMAKEIGNLQAQLWGTAHEKSSTDELATEMDLANNKSGRMVYAALSIINIPTDTELKNDLLKRIKDGGLVRIVNRKLVPTDGSDRK